MKQLERLEAIQCVRNSEKERFRERFDRAMIDG